MHNLFVLLILLEIKQVRATNSFVQASKKWIKSLQNIGHKTYVPIHFDVTHI